MRLAILISHPIQYYTPLFRELARRCDIHVFYSHRMTPGQHATSGFGVPFEWDVDLLDGYASTFLANISRNPGPSHFSGCDTPEIADRLRDGNFDALLVTGWYLKCFVQGLWAAKRLGLPILVRGDSQLRMPRPPVKRFTKAFFLPAFLRLYDAALYVGQRSREYYEYYGLAAQRLFFSPHCVDSKWFSDRATAAARECLRKQHGITGDAKVVLFAGKLLPFKRPFDLIKAAAQCRATGAGVEVMIAGSGELEAELVRLAHKLAIPLHLLGFCNQTQMPAAYAAADILVLPSEHHETWGLVANEALACGRPIILSDAVGSAPDLVGDQSVGRTFHVGDIAGLAHAICSLLDNPPSMDLISAKSAARSPAIAATGILRAAEYAAGEVR